LGERGVRVTAFDIPFVFPAPAPNPNVLEVLNWGSHDLVGPFWASDARLARRIRGEFGLHPMGYEVPVAKSKAQLTRALNQLTAGAALKARLATWLMRERPWDVFVIAFGETHRAGHTIWPHPEDGENYPAPRDGLTQVYQALDRAVGLLTQEAGEGADIVLFALHGMGENSSQCHLTSTFMRRVTARFKGEPVPSDQGDAPGLVRTLRRVVPAQLQFAIAAAVPCWVRDQVVAREIDGGYEWSNTLGFCLHGDLAGYLRLNLEGRERNGAVLKDRQSDLREFIRTELEALQTLSGRSLVRRVLFPAHDWPGARAHLLPDILVEWVADLPPQGAISSPTLGVIRARHSTGRGGNHRFNGFYRHYGPRKGAGVHPRHIADLGALVEAMV
jgi:predicted AlkP superfamily phosphohydrolase/phosphomutase